jgi:hypothetical protein
MTPTLPSEVIESQSESGKSGMKIDSAERGKADSIPAKRPSQFFRGSLKITMDRIKILATYCINCLHDVNVTQCEILWRAHGPGIDAIVHCTTFAFPEGFGDPLFLCETLI